MKTPIDRRDFLKTTTLAAGTAVAGFGAAPAIARARGANDRVSVGFVGLGRMGQGNIRHALATGRADVAAVCDVYEPQIAPSLARVEAAGAPAPDVYPDFRRILDRDDIDAVVVSSPDHWHALHTVLACEAGKDVFVEKPLATSVEEGRRMVDVARRTGRVVQVGTMQRSAGHFQKAVEIVRSGRLGDVTFVRCWNTNNEHPDGFGDVADSAPPPGLDWEAWLGPAPDRPFNANRFGVSDDRFSTFRFFWDYAGGMLTDWGVHLMDIAVWAMGETAPRTVSSVGGRYHLRDNRDTPDTLQSTFEFDDWVMTYTNQACNSFGLHDRGYGILFHGTDATLFVDRRGYELMPEYYRRGGEIESRPRSQPVSGYSVGSGNREHHDDFFDCIDSREKPICDVEVGHDSTTLTHLGNIAYRTKSTIRWDADAERCLDNPEANALLGREYRAPWRL